MNTTSAIATASTDTMNDHITAETLEAILQAPTVEALEDAVQSLPIDVEAFHDRMQAIEATEPRPSPVEARQAITEALQACALPGCVVNALFASLMTRAIFELGRLRAESPTDRAELLADLREAVAADDEVGLELGYLAVGSDNLQLSIAMQPGGFEAVGEVLEAVETGPVQTPAKTRTLCSVGFTSAKGSPTHSRPPATGHVEGGAL